LDYYHNLCLFLQPPSSLRTPATYHNLCFYLQPLFSLKLSQPSLLSLTLPSLIATTNSRFNGLKFLVFAHALKQQIQTASKNFVFWISPHLFFRLYYVHP
jgi:hypothetical protein